MHDLELPTFQMREQKRRCLCPGSPWSPPICCPLLDPPGVEAGGQGGGNTANWGAQSH